MGSGGNGEARLAGGAHVLEREAPGAPGVSGALADGEAEIELRGVS